MSSRVPPPNPGDSRYNGSREPRDRSLPRNYSRRPSAPYGGGPLAARITDPTYRSNEPHGYSGSGRDLQREPPRGPKALLDGSRGNGSHPRGRGFAGRGDARDRESRDSRDTPVSGRGRDRDWGARENFDNSRERRPSPTGRNRSRSPALRDYRDPRDFSPLKVDQNRVRRNSRDGPMSASSSVSDALPSSNFRGRGAFRGRGRGEWDYNRRGRGDFHGDREGFRPRSGSHDRMWDRNREREQETSRRADDVRKNWESREREPDRDARAQNSVHEDLRNTTGDRDMRDQNPLNTELRSSIGAPPTPSTCQLTSASLTQQANAEGFTHNARAFSAESARGPAEKMVNLAHANAADLALFRTNKDRQGPSTVSPPPQAPEVPAFGSITSRTPVLDQSTGVGRGTTRIEAPPQSSLPNAGKGAPLGPKAQLVSQAPTGPKSEHYSERRSAVNYANPSGQSVGNERTLHVFSHLAATSLISTESDTNHYPNMAQNPMQSRGVSDVYGARALGPHLQTQPVQNGESTPSSQPYDSRTVEELERYGNAPSTVSAPAAMRQPSYEISNQHSPMKIPTGPRAERIPPSVRQTVAPPVGVPSSRASMPPWQPRQSNLKWVRPGHTQHIPRGPSIMKIVPTKIQHGGDEKVRNAQTDHEMREAEVPHWSRPHINSQAAPVEPKPDYVSKGDTASPAFDVQTHKPEDVDESNAMEGLYEQPASIMLISNERKRTDSDDAGVEDEMTLDEDDFAKAEQNFERRVRALELKRPPTPRNHTALLPLLDECDALASAAEDKAREVAGEPLHGHSVVDHLQTGLPSPKLEDPQNYLEDHYALSVVPVKIRRQTPPIESLPFFISGPPTPFSDFEELQEHLDQHEAIKAQIIEDIAFQRRNIAYENDEIKAKFAQDYRNWRLEIETMETLGNLNSAATSEPMSPTPAIPVSITSVPSGSSRRATKNMSELDLAKVIKDSLQESQLAEEKQNEERNRKAKDLFNPEKEATIPDMLSECQRKTYTFADATHLINTELVLDDLAFCPGQDDFTAEEHEIFLDNYLIFPKKWGTIADALDGRDYQDCVQHYYLTKGQAQYKDKEKAFSRIKKGRKGRGLQGRPKTNVIMPLFGGPVVYDTPQVPVTDTGRPKRAAAPVFGDAGDPEAATPAATPVRRSINGAKGDINGDISEKPSNKRTRAAPSKDKGAKKGKVPVLAAAPIQSTQKLDTDVFTGKSKEPKLESENRAEEIEGAQLLAGLHISQVVDLPVTPPLVNEGWLGTQLTVMNAPIQIQKQQQPPVSEQLHQHLQQQQQQLQQQPRGAPPTTSSYWSVPDQTDFTNLIHHFGTDWQAIANTLKTKTQTMVKNHYFRLIERPENDTLEKAAQLANQRIKNGDDMGPPPAPTIVPKRRYDTTPHIASQRPLAPSLDTMEIENESPRLQPTKSMQLSPSQYNQASPRFPTLAQAEPGSMSMSSQPSTQPPTIPTNRVVGPIQPQRIIPQLQGPRSGFFSSEDRSRPLLQAQPVAQQQVQQQMQQQVQQQVQQQAQQQVQQQAQQQVQQQVQVQVQVQQEHQARLQNQHQAQERQRLQSYQDACELQGNARQEAQQISMRYQAPVRNQQPQQQAPSGLQLAPSSQIRIAPSQPVDIEIRTHTVGHPQQQHQQQQQKQSQQLEPQHHQQTDSPSIMRRLESYSKAHNRPAAMPSPASGRLPFAGSPLDEKIRPSSVPVAAQQQQQAPRPNPVVAKRSNIMNILNDEPTEPQPRKRLSDQRSAAPTPPPRSPAVVAQAYPQPSHVQQHIHRRDIPTEPAHHVQHQRPPSSQPHQQHQLQSQPREITSNWSAAAPRSFYEQRSTFPSQSTQSPQLQPSFVQQSSRAPFPSLQRTHAPSPPPSQYSHSRASSYTNISSHHHQSQHPPAPATQQAGPPLQPSPYSQLHHQQHLPSQSQHQPSQSSLQQIQQRPPQQPNPSSSSADPTFLSHPQYLRQREAMSKQQEALQQPRQPMDVIALQRQQEMQKDAISQQQEALQQQQQQRQQQPQAILSIQRQQQEIQRRAQDSLRQDQQVQRRTYTPPLAYGVGGGGHGLHAPPGQQERGRYEDRR